MNWKNDFPIFKNYPELVYLDSAATSQKPQRVLDRILDFYTRANANVHRGIYLLSEKATEEYETAREKVAAFLSVNKEEIIFTSGTTEAANLISHSHLSTHVKAGDLILSSVAEHHSNFLPLQRISNQIGAELKLINLSADQDLDYQQLSEIIAEAKDRLKVVALSAVSNVLGFKLDLAKLTSLVRQYSPRAVIIIDAAQAVGHFPFNPAAADIDFAFFSGHKLFAETGIGVLWGKKALLDLMPPFHVGGGMIANVTTERTTYAPVPVRFEAGTPHISGAISLAAAVDYISSIGIDQIESYLNTLSEKLLAQLGNIDGITILGPRDANKRSSVISFTVEGIHPHDVAQFLSDKNIAVRAGHHCTQILHKDVFDISGSVRASLHIYNDESDIDRFIEAISQCVKYYQQLHEQ